MSTSKNPIQKVIQNRNFRLLWAGQGASLLGDQFEMIAAPWLVLKLTHDPLALGFVLALSSIPRAVFMLVGGAVTDRFSERTIMLISDILRLALTTVMTVLIFTNGLQTWMLYAFALHFGLVGGFFNPASSSIVPHIIGKEDLHSANSLIQGTAQMTNFAGPVLAGGMIAVFSSASSVGMEGIAMAFGLDAVSFLVSILTLWKIRLSSTQKNNADSNVLNSIKEGIQFAMQDSSLKVIFILIAAANLFFVGPLYVGMPVLAQQRLEGSAAAFGLIMSAYGAGNVIGILSAGSLPKPKAELLNILIVGLFALFGSALVGFAFVSSTWMAFGMLLVIGTGNGYFAITLITLIQQRTPSNRIGRVMSMVLFANVGLIPISQALSGLIIKYNLPELFIGAGVLMVVLAGWAALNRDARALGDDLLKAFPAD
ncbi:MAG: MFS transporter [Anaerolineaceae bacterium]|nr:MFS transporter [Anaerolineaceae bacterium]